MTESFDSKNTRKILRIHVGGISKELAQDIQELESRFAKVGKIVKPFEIHEKSVVEYHFGFVTMELNRSEFNQLKKLWNDIRFKGSKLTVAIAKDDYFKRWDKDSKRQDNKISARQKREKVTEARNIRISNRNMNPFDLALVSKGRIRKTPRKTDLKNLTIRVNINGKLKIIKCKKTKLWGVDKNRSIRDLTTRFIAGEWRDGNDHVVDRLSEKVIVFNNNKITVEHKNAEESGKDEVEDELMEEKLKNNMLLEDMLNKYNFNKPVELDADDKDEDYANFDYELEHRVSEPTASDEDEDEHMDITYNIPEKDCIHPSRTTLIEEYNAYNNSLPVEEKEEEEEEDDDEDFYKNLKPEVSSPNHTNETHDGEFIPTFGNYSESNIVQHEDNEDEDEEFIPTFGDAKVNYNDTKTNTTEKLRELLSSENIRQEPKEETELLKNSSKIEILPSVRKSKDVGLFFPHFDSPFLVAQSQINKLRELKINEELKYDDWFWENRGDLNREFRRLRRDILRRNKKKSKAASFI